MEKNHKIIDELKNIFNNIDNDFSDEIKNLIDKSKEKLDTLNNLDNHSSSSEKMIENDDIDTLEAALTTAFHKILHLLKGIFPLDSLLYLRIQIFQG